MNSPAFLVSVIMPCYNQAHYLSEALDSVLKQTYNNWECVIVDDGSPDNTATVAKAYCDRDVRFKYFYKDNGGVASARNFGILNSVGYFILPLDADDLIAPTYIEKAVNVFYNKPITKLVYCRAEKFGMERGEWLLPEYNYEDFLFDNCIFCSCMYRREDFDRTIGYNQNMVYGLEDWDFLISLLNSNSIVFRIDQILFFYRTKKISRTITNSYKLYLSWYQIIMNHPAVYREHFERTLDKLSSSYDNIVCYYKTSLPYRIGLALLTPYRFVKHKLTGRYYESI